MIEVRLPHSVLGALVLGPLLALALLRTHQGMPFPLECRFEEYAEDPEFNRVVKAALGINWAEAPKTSTDKEYLAWRSILLAKLINVQLRPCPTALVPAYSSEQGIELGAFVFTSWPPDLLTAAYADFATLVARRAELKECPGCGVLFHPKSGKQKYHDPSCAGSARWRRWKEKQTN